MVLAKPDISISSVLSPFQFDRGSNACLYNDTLQMFQTILRESMHQIKKQLKEAEPESWEHLNELLLNLDDCELDSYLLQPEVSNHLLYRNKDDVSGLRLFLLDTLTAQLAKKTHCFDAAHYPSLWSANGDYLIGYNAAQDAFEEYEALRINERIPVDFFSPYCQGLSQDEIQEDESTRFDLYSIEEAEQVFEHMESSILPLLPHDNIIELICLFNNVVMVKKQICSNGRQPFISGSDGFYIGRTHVMNPEIVAKEPLAEMFVHEAIHSVLYMIDENNKWMPSLEDAMRIGITVPSNWSGNLLSIRSYFQAVFVWFGIFNFWKYSLTHNMYDVEYITKRLQFVIQGFKTLDINVIRRKYSLELSEETVYAVDTAKQLVLEHV